MDGSEGNHSDWPLRPWVLAGGLALTGFLVWLAAHDASEVPWRMAATAFVLFGGLAAAFTFERDRWKEPLVFSLVAGLVMAGIAWRATAAGDHYSDEEFWVVAGVIATGLALPLFQAGFHRTRFATPYERVHYHVWSDAIAAGGSLAFTGAAWLLLLILSELFHLLQIDVLRDLMNNEWFGWTYSGAAFGAALGTLQNQIRLFGLARDALLTVLSILAVPLAAGLALFLVAMIVSGPNVLWEATRSATPVLLMCAAGAWVLANAILRDTDGEMSRNRVLHWAACALALAILPLTVFAAISLGTRIDQHGLSPERLWGLVAIAVACAYGLAWFVALVRGWKGKDWRDRLRQANLHLAALICVVALVLALPIFNFGVLSASNQVARLASGKVKADDFDYSALRWGFGDAGRKALARLTKDKNPRVAELASTALAQKVRYYRFDGDLKTPEDFKLRVQPEDPELRKLVLAYLTTSPWECSEECVALDLGAGPNGGRAVALVYQSGFTKLELPLAAPDERAVAMEVSSATLKPDSTVEIREVPKRYIFIDGKPLGQPLD